MRTVYKYVIIRALTGSPIKYVFDTFEHDKSSQAPTSKSLYPRHYLNHHETHDSNTSSLLDDKFS